MIVLFYMTHIKLIEFINLNGFGNQ
jgi:hypothetical protein